MAGSVNSSNGQLYAAILVTLAVAALGTLRVLGDRRFRIRATLPDTPRLRRARRVFGAALVTTVLGLALLLVPVAGGPAWLRPAGIAAAGIGYVALAAALVAILRQRVRRSRRDNSRPAT